mmetsp:Transcript_21903/g.22078  ORF Transcript_21903/g.22078 Transcript_21903/m.22078 type:complete len:82 (+) Transcript_21903:205-450(+)
MKITVIKPFKLQMRYLAFETPKYKSHAPPPPPPSVLRKYFRYGFMAWGVFLTSYLIINMNDNIKKMKENERERIKNEQYEV